MKTWKLVSGIISIILFVLVSLQSCAAGVVNTLAENGDVSGTAGFIVAVLMLAGGIVSIATRKSEGDGGNIALAVMFGIAALLGFAAHGIFYDLIIWACWCLINAVLAVVAIARNSNQLNKRMQNTRAFQNQYNNQYGQNMTYGQYNPNGQNMPYGQYNQNGQFSQYTPNPNYSQNNQFTQNASGQQSVQNDDNTGNA